MTALSLLVVSPILFLRVSYQDILNLHPLQTSALEVIRWASSHNTAVTLYAVLICQDLPVPPSRSYSSRVDILQPSYQQCELVVFAKALHPFGDIIKSKSAKAVV